MGVQCNQLISNDLRLDSVAISAVKTLETCQSGCSIIHQIGLAGTARNRLVTGDSALE